MDSSGYGAVEGLIQEDAQGIYHPVSFFYHKSNHHQRNYSTIEKEALVLQYFLPSNILKFMSHLKQAGTLNQGHWNHESSHLLHFETLTEFRDACLTSDSIQHFYLQQLAGFVSHPDVLQNTCWRILWACWYVSPESSLEILRWKSSDMLASKFKS